MGRGEKESPEGSAFAAGVLPYLAACNEAAAATVYGSMEVGASSVDFPVVKAAFGGEYNCMGAASSQVGGLWDSSSGDYYGGFEPEAEGYALIAGYLPLSQVTDHVSTVHYCHIVIITFIEL